MGADEVYIGQPAKKRKLDDGNSMTCDLTDNNTQSQESIDLSNSAIDSCQVINDLSRDSQVDSKEVLTESIEDPSESAKAPRETTMESTENTKDPNDPTIEPTDTISVSQDKLRNIVSKEDMERLRQFHVLDEVKSNEEDSNDEHSEESDGVEVPDEEVEMMLDADLPEEIKGAPKVKEKAYVTIQKTVLEEKGVNHFEVLPMDWIMVRHISGMPIYMHRPTRVCTLSKPYFLGMNNTRRHDIPISAIPCYAYRRALEEEEKQKEVDKKIEEQIRNGTWATVTNNTEINKNYIDSNTQTTTDVRNSNCARVVLSAQSNQKQGAASLNQHIIESTEENQTESTEEQASEIASQQMLEPDYPTTETNNQLTSVCPYKWKSSVEKLCDTLQTTPVSMDSENSKSANEQTPETSSQSTSSGNLKSESGERGIELSSEKIAQSSNQSISTETCDNINLESDQNIGNSFERKALESTSHISVDSTEQSLDSIKQELLEEASALKEEILKDSSENKCPYKNGTTSTENIPNPTDASSNVPTSAIDSIPLDRRPVILPGGIVMPPPRVETVRNSWKTQHLTPEQITNYCKNLFKFKTINIMHFKRWAHRRKYTKARKTLQYPTLPEGTKLITIPAQPAGPGQEKGGRANKRDWVMNMNDRSYLSVFHEYVGRALQKQPVYHFRQLENAAAPYQAVVSIGGMQYGVGYGSSKRQAKSAAARASIQILMPEMKDELAARDPLAPADPPEFHDFFDLVSIEDPRITEFCAATCEPSPHAILRTCLLRNFGAQDHHIHVEMKKLEYQKIELTMKVGKHTASVICKNKKTAKQRASQAILQALHPHVRSWGSLLRLYGSKSVKSCKEKKVEEQQITLLQDKARHNEPNYAVLDKLRNEMRKLRERDAAVVPIGTLLLQDDLPTHSGSNLNNVEL